MRRSPQLLFVGRTTADCVLGFLARRQPDQSVPAQLSSLSMMCVQQPTRIKLSALLTIIRAANARPLTRPVRSVGLEIQRLDHRTIERCLVPLHIGDLNLAECTVGDPSFGFHPLANVGSGRRLAAAFARYNLPVATDVISPPASKIRPPPSESHPACHCCGHGPSIGNAL
jgi:hypothetical protein